MKPEVTRTSIFDMQVCVPSDWTDEQAEEFANEQNPSGLELGWKMLHNGNKYLGGAGERVNCSKRDGYVHIRLEC